MIQKELAALGPDHPVGTMLYMAAGPDGDPRWYQWKNRAILDERGQLMEYQSVGSDVTELKRSEAELKGLVYGLTEMPVDQGVRWYQRPLPLACVVGVALLLLNLWFW